MVKRRSVPIYESIKKDIRNRIESGELKPGDRVNSEQEIAREMGVSRNQTRQALRDLEMEGYLERTPGRGSFVTPEHLRRGAPGAMTLQTVAFTYPQESQRSSTVHLRSLVRGFVDGVNERQNHPLFYYLNYDHEAELRFLRSVRESGVVGAALWPQFRCDDETNLVADLAQSPWPCVLVDRYLRDIECDFVGTANLHAYEKLTGELVRRGCRTIAYLARDFRDTVMEDRLKGYRRALALAGLPCHDHLVMQCAQDDMELLSNLVTKAFSGPVKPDAIVCSHFLKAKDLMAVAKPLGYTAPTDFQIACVDDNLDFEAPGKSPYVIAVQNGYAVGRQAADMVFAQREGGHSTFERRFVKAKFLF